MGDLLREEVRDVSCIHCNSAGHLMPADHRSVVLEAYRERRTPRVRANVVNCCLRNDVVLARRVCIERLRRDEENRIRAGKISRRDKTDRNLIDRKRVEPRIRERRSPCVCSRVKANDAPLK